MDSGSLDLAARIGVLEKDMRHLITRWEMFFSGELKVPPNQEKDKLNRRLRLLAEHSSNLRSGDRFRLNQLQHRFMSYAMNWERQLREREEGVRRWNPARQVPQTPPPVSRPNAEPPAHVDSHDDDLYGRWCAEQAKLGQKVTIDREAFDRKMDQQRNKIEAKTGAPVTFEVKVVDGKVKVSARRAAREKDGM